MSDMSKTRRASIAVAAAAGAVLVGLIAVPTANAASARATYIVTVAKGSERSVEARAAALGGTVGYRYGTVLNGFSVELPVAAADGLAHAAGVVTIEADAPVSIATTDSPVASWGLGRIDDKALFDNTSYSYTSTGAGVTAYIIDTGIDGSKTDFGARVAGGINFVGSTTGNDLWADCQGHGTHVAGTVGSANYGVAKAVRLFAVRVLDCSGSGTNAGVIAGVNWVAANHGAGTVVANMSLGGGLSSALNTAVANASNAGVVVAVAAGNGNMAGVAQDACKSSPASAPSAITVGATDSADAKASFSNYGKCLDIFAPGVGITSYAYLTGGTATWSGTSMATPHVTGAIARYLSTVTGATVSSVTTWITGNATPNVVKNAGKGSPNRLLYIAPGA